MNFSLVGLKGQIVVALGLSPLLLGSAAGCVGRSLDGPDTLGDGDGDGDGSGGSGDDGATSNATTSMTSIGSATAEGSGEGTDTGPMSMCVASDQWMEWEVYRPIGPDGTCVCDEECQQQAFSEWDQANCCSSCWYSFGEVLCAETLGDQCHFITTMYEEGCGKGRPLLVENQARLAAPMSRGDWATEGLRPCVDALDPEARTRIGEYWRAAALAEHASVASFARFSLDLMALGAPPTLLADATTAMHDEIRHASIAFALASEYLCSPTGPGPLPVEGVTVASDAASIVRAAVREGCIEETLAAAEAELAARRATDPAVRRALREIAEDEARHAVLAWRFVDWAVRRDRSLAAVVREELAAAQAGMAAAALRAAPVESIDPAIGRAHGLVPAADRTHLRAQCFAETVRVCAEGMLAAIA